MTDSFASVQRLAYLAASLLFILSLRGLSTQQTGGVATPRASWVWALAVVVTALALRARGTVSGAGMVHAEAWGLHPHRRRRGAAVGRDAPRRASR